MSNEKKQLPHKSEGNAAAFFVLFTIIMVYIFYCMGLHWLNDATAGKHEGELWILAGAPCIAAFLAAMATAYF